MNGAIGLTTMTAKGNSMEDQWVWYLAGVFDTAAVITVKIQKHEEYAIGYDFQPQLTLSRQTSKNVVFGMIDELAEEEGFNYRIEDYGDNTERMVIQRSISLEKILNLLIGGFVQQREQAELMLNEIIPAVRDEEHRTKEGFYELMSYVDELREMNFDNHSSKYTQQYFKDEWGEEVLQ